MLWQVKLQNELLAVRSCLTLITVLFLPFLPPVYERNLINQAGIHLMSSINSSGKGFEKTPRKLCATVAMNRIRKTRHGYIHESSSNLTEIILGRRLHGI